MNYFSRNLHKKKNIQSLLLSAAASAILFGVASCGAGEKNNNESLNLLVLAANDSFREVSFNEAKFPNSTALKTDHQVATTISINGIDQQIGYTKLIRSGEVKGTGTFGIPVDSTMVPIPDGTDIGYTMRNGGTGKSGPSTASDFNSLIQKDGSIFMISHFEDVIGSIYISKLHQNVETGALTVQSTKPVNMSSVKGIYIPCAGSVSPWNSHLGSEEYEPNALKANTDTNMKYYAAYLGAETPNPYWYGWIPEIKILNSNGDTSVVKHFAMGRFAHELSKVLPDKKTVYLADDGSNTGLYLFVADKEEDLSAGTLYAAKWTQKSANHGGSANITWLNLGHASNTEIKNAINAGITFGAMFEPQTSPAFDPATPSTCSVADGYKYIDVEGSGKECLKLKTGNFTTGTSIEKLASRLETRRYAALKGASIEFNKEEGITYNTDASKLYVAMSSIKAGMIDTTGDIQIPSNPCGGIYSLDLGGEKKDISGNPIKSSFVAFTMAGEVMGEQASALDFGFIDFGTDKTNTCKAKSIANPDNVAYMEKSDILIIGEDTNSGEHQNDAVFAYNVTTKSLTRIWTTPYGSETTSPYFYRNINGWSYLMVVTQHPYGESDTAGKKKSWVDFNGAEGSPTIPSFGDTLYPSYVGYIGPFRY
ncbi:hypothetical protein CH373_18150 [Leptospira perolatii]|uniref:Alkaline phosphatase n=1 Tax=Leptospira perolatii TaxID=2023191 RepID=A0A2M9ZI89_9LEPT|nr:alkaline phosphatase PhoX [Leptospira perolatii]PJZ68005.1 hypothetical protein CH360_18465 [Leptospira perolatii]PJZ71684.1 hypothetical protein CH373_18150 [Leptospira perolatii]